MAIIENINVSSPNDGLGDSLRNSQIKANNNFAELNAKKVEKVAGQDLSQNNFTDALKSKLDSLEVGAGVQIQADWIQNDISAKDYIKNKPELSQYFSAVGGFDYEDLATATTPLSYTTGFLQLTNDTLGANTRIDIGPYGVEGVWEALDNAFIFSELSIGDEVFLRVHISITTTTANQISGLSLLFGEGTSSEYRLPIDMQMYHKTAGIHDVTKEISFYIGNNDWRDTPVKIQFNSDSNASVKIFGWHPYIIRKSINILDVNDDNYKTFNIINIEANNDDDIIPIGSVSIGYNSITNKVNTILFDEVFSSYITNYDALKSMYDFSLNFVDKTNGKSFVSFINAFDLITSRYKITLQETLDYTNFAINNKIEVFINATKKGGGGVESDTLQTVTDRGNITTNGIEVSTLKATSLPNANLDATYTKSLKIKNDGTIGAEDIVQNDYLTVEAGIVKRVKIVTIPASAVEISIGFFVNQNISEVVLNNGLQIIRQLAFESNNITNLTIPNTVTTLDRGAFYRNKLISLTLSNSLTTLGQLDFPNPAYGVFGVNFLTNVILPNSLTVIGGYSFYDNLLSSVTLPNNLTTIGSGAFYINKLTSITIPSTVTSIREGAFFSNLLTAVTLPAGCTYYSNSFDVGVVITGGILI